MGLEHSALFYHGEDEFLDAVTPFVLDGVRQGEPVFVSVPPHNLSSLRGALGEAASSVVLVDMAETGVNPARVFGQFTAFSQEHADEGLRWVSEPVWPGRAADAYPACIQNEALVNIAFPGRNLRKLCPYDADRLSDDVLAEAQCAHPFIREEGRVTENHCYSAEEALARANKPLVTDPTAVTLAVHDLDDLSRARAFGTRYAHRVGMSPDGVGDLKLIITELATNSLEHTGKECCLALWTHVGSLVCEIRDHGHLDDPLAGRRAPTRDAKGGRGLFLINAMADLVRTHTGTDGTTMQVYLRLNDHAEATA